MVYRTVRRYHCGVSDNTSASGDWLFNDPFKAKYPDKSVNANVKFYQRILRKFYQRYNDYDPTTRQTRYQFTLQNHLIWVSSDSSVPKLYKKIRKPTQTCDDKVIIRTPSAAQQGQPRRAASCQETAWGVTANKDVDSHWLTWNTGELEPPGLQTRLAKPYPTPEPPSDYGAKGFVSPKLVRESTPKRRTPNPPATQRPTRTASSTGSQCVVRDAKAGGSGNNYNPSPHPCFRSWHTSHCDGYGGSLSSNSRVITSTLY